MRLITLSFVFALSLCTFNVVKGQDCSKDTFLLRKNLDLSKLEDTPNGKIVRLSCAVGYVGLLRFKCENGEWIQQSGRPCELKSCGHPGDTENGDFSLTVSDDFVFGAQVEYTCRKGYQMVTRTRHRNCMEQGWVGALPICEAVKCPVIQANKNVMVIGDSEDATYGNVIQFECQSSQMVLKGPSEIDCNVKGEWSGAVPTCEEIKCHAPDIANGQVTVKKAEYKEDEILRYSCNPNYIPHGRLSKCNKIGNRADWSPTPECVEITCRLTPTRGVQYTPDGKTIFKPDDILKVTCPPGYWFFFSRQKEHTVTCKQDGSWSDPMDCESIRCPVPNDPLVSDTSRWRTADVDDIRSYACINGYKARDKLSKATCTSDGTWTPTPLCEEITCDLPEIPMVTIQRSKTKYKYGEKLTYECKMNKEPLFSPPTSTCSIMGWNPIPGCKDKEGACPPLTNGFLVKPEHSDPNSSIFYYSCNKGFKPFTKGWWGVATCNEGTWSANPTCIDETQCGQIPYIPNAKEDTKNGATVTIICKDGYRTDDKKTIICKDGKWETPLPECKLKDNQCDPPPHVENALVEIEYQKKYIHGKTIKYKCRKSFQIEEHDEIKCNSGTWESSQGNNLPKCKQYCGKLKGAPKKMQIVNQVNMEDRYENGQEVLYKCNSPYTVKGSGGKGTCKNGQWNKTVECEARCPDPKIITNGEYNEEKTDEDGVITEVSYRCEQDFVLSSKDVIKCKNGKWDPLPVCLKYCEIPQLLKDYNLKNLKTTLTLLHGTKATMLAYLHAGFEINGEHNDISRYNVFLPSISRRQGYHSQPRTKLHA
ncbi:hypothetical protein UPYG_G00033070, partial [Umbra pygmaea]